MSRMCMRSFVTFRCVLTMPKAFFENGQQQHQQEQEEQQQVVKTVVAHRDPSGSKNHVDTIMASSGHVTSWGACPTDRPWTISYRLSVETIPLFRFVFEIFSPKVARKIIRWWRHEWRHNEYLIWTSALTKLQRISIIGRWKASLMPMTVVLLVLVLGVVTRLR